MSNINSNNTQKTSKESRLKVIFSHPSSKIAGFSVCMLAVYFALLIFAVSPQYSNIPLFVTYIFGGIPLVFELLKKIYKGEFGSDLLAGVSIVTSVVLGEYLAGVIVIIMLSGGEALEDYALKNASAVLNALSKRMPQIARLKTADGAKSVPLEQIKIGDLLELIPHDIAPVDGLVVEGQGSMDESYLTGEPFNVRKIQGSSVLSGAINGESMLVIQATELPVDSRYQKIAKVIESQASKQVPMRRLGDRLGAWYTPLAILIALVAYLFSGEASRFLAVLVVATPCPLLLAIPITIIGSISLLAKRGIIIKDPSCLENISSCRTLILDKTGTLTYGKPYISKIDLFNGFSEEEVLKFASALEEYSKHPLASAIIDEAKKRGLQSEIVSSVSEKPGEGLSGVVNSRTLRVLGRKQLKDSQITLPEKSSNELECILLVDEKLAALFHFFDKPRTESKSFVSHIGPKHSLNKVMILSGDRKESVEALANMVGIQDIEGGLSPEEKVVRVKEETLKQKTLYIGDGINDAPSLQIATVGIALGTRSDITSEAADLVILDGSLSKVDEFIHIGHNMKQIALQSAVGGILFSFIGMILAAFGFITPLVGAVSQEVIDVVAILNALRAVKEPEILSHELKE